MHIAAVIVIPRCLGGESISNMHKYKCMHAVLWRQRIVKCFTVVATSDAASSDDDSPSHFVFLLIHYASGAKWNILDSNPSFRVGVRDLT